MMNRSLICGRVLAVLMFAGFSLLSARAQDYFVTYSHDMEDPGDLEIETRSVVGHPRGGNAFLASVLEFEYGVRAWWTSEFYLDGQTTGGQSTVFTGFRWENRFRPLLREHWINPVFYVEFANLNSANKSLLEITGHDGRQEFLARNHSGEKEREAELRLILSSNARGWNISENIIMEKDLANEPWEFGYTVAVSRPLAAHDSTDRCAFCRKNLVAGAELYGGLGDRHRFGLHDTSHYFAPLVSWHAPNGLTLKLSPGLGLNDYSHGFLLRFGISYEVEDFVSKLRGH